MTANTNGSAPDEAPQNPESDGKPKQPDEIAADAAKASTEDKAPSEPVADACAGEPAAEAHQQQPQVGSNPPGTESSAVEAARVRPVDIERADDVLPHPASGDEPSATHSADAEVLAASRAHTRRAFAIGGIAAAAAYGFYHWLDYGPHRDLLPTLVDRAYGTNAAVSRAVFHDRALAPTYPLRRAETLRVNGVFGLKKELEMSSYRLQVVGAKDAEQNPRYVSDVTAWDYRYKGESGGDRGHDTKVNPKQETSKKMAPASEQAKAQEDEQHTGRRPRGLEEAGESYSTLRRGTPGLLLTLDDFVPKLPRHELVTQFKCIEGWSQIVHWAGVRMADFLELYPPALVNGREPRYVYMETPDGDYYVGYDMHICRHPQTLLVTEMMGAPLAPFHGAPVRIHMPTKYGYKQIKRIGLILYTDVKPDDYWTKLGYDWYAGL